MRFNIGGCWVRFRPPPLDESNAAELAEDEISVNINSNVPLQQWKAVGPQNADGSLIAGNDGNGDAAWSYVANGNYIVNNANQSPLSGYIHPNVNLSEFDLYTTIGSWDQDDDFMGVMFCTKTYGVNNWDSYYFLLDGPPGTPLGSWNTGTGASAGLYKTKNATLGSWAKICATNTHALKWVRGAYVQLHVKVTKTAENKPHIQIWFNNKLEIDYVDDSTTAILDGSIGFWSMSQSNARFKDIRYTARLATYTVKLEANGSNVHMNDTTPVQGIHTKTWKKDLPTPTRNGYIFKGWNTMADGTGTDMTNIIKAGAPVNVSSDITLYAQWEKNPFIIEATPNVDGFGSATVSWPTYDYCNKNFKVYQSSDGGETWNTVGIDYTSVTNVKCLQIYPCDAAKNQLKEWAVNSGYGQGKISVDAVSQEAFNMSSETILKDEQGNYRYDVLYFGTWDANDNKDMIDASVQSTADFIKSGRGVIFGHDCLNNWVGTSAHNEKFNDLIGLCGVTAPEKVTIIDSQNYTQTKIKISQTGLMTNYPNFIGNVGQILDIPATHITGFSTPNSRVWYSFDESILKAFKPTFDDMLGYCSTYNNTALLSTGHSNNQATPDEQKLLANLIFYMNQLLFEKATLRDASAQDTTAPTIESHLFHHNAEQIEIAGKDAGNTYQYYAESYDKEDTTETGFIHKSNIAEANVTTGIRQYKYMYTPTEDTPSDWSSALSIEASDTATIGYTEHRNQYLHIIAVDGAGNESAPVTFRIPDTSTMDIPGQKLMSDKSRQFADEFSFSLFSASSETSEASERALISIARNAEDGTFAFEDIPLTADTLSPLADGTYEVSFRARENDEKDKNVIYDDTEYDIRVIVSDADADGALNVDSITVRNLSSGEVGGMPVFTNTRLIVMPETGEDVVLIALAMVAGFVLVLSALGAFGGRRRE